MKEEKKTLFMDIDGVLTTEWSFSQPLRFLDALTSYEPYVPESVEALNAIIKAFDANIIIHSSRRYQFSEEEFKVIWSESGICYGNLSVLPRYGDEDDKWFDHPNEEKEYDLKKIITLNGMRQEYFIVLEDERLKVSNLYLVNSGTGLTMADAEKIIHMDAN